MTRLALRLLRHRPGSATATLIALTFGVMILMAMGSMVEAGLRLQQPPQRFAGADVVIARTELTITGRDLDGSRTTSTVRLPEPGRLPADLAEQVRAVPGVTGVSAVPGAVLADTAPGVDRAALDRIAAAAGAQALTGDDRGRAENSAGAAARDLLIQAGAAFGGYVVLLVVFVVAGIVSLSVRHRRRDLALLRAVGATPGQVRRMLTAETMLISAAATVLGLPAGVVATGWLRGEMAGRGFLPPDVAIPAGVLAAVAAATVTALVAALAALVAARRATAIRPVEALGEVAVEPQRSGRVRLVSGLVTLTGALSVSGVAAGSGGQTALTGALGMLYLFVTAVALLAPWINRGAADLLAPVLRAVWGAPGRLAAANLRANARGTATVLTSLVLSIGFGGSVWFLQDNLQRQAVGQTRDGMLAQQAVLGAPASTADDLRRVPGVQAAVGVRTTSVLVEAFDTAEVVPARAIDPDGASAALDLRVVEGSLDDLGAGGVAVSQMQASSNGWRVGGEASMWLADGTAVRLPVVAIYQRSLGFGDVVLDNGDGPVDQILVRASPGTDLAPALAAHPGAEVVPAAGLTGRLAADLATSAWLNKLLVAVMIGYAALAAANAMVLAALSRGRELATLRLAGGTRRQIARMVHAEQAGLLGMSVVIGGVVAAGTLVAVIHAVTGSWLPYVPVTGWLVILAGTTLLAMATTVLPVRHLLRTPAVLGLGARE